MSLPRQKSQLNDGEEAMTDLLHAPGFLGTSANFAADMTLILSILVGLTFTFGAWLAKRAQSIEAKYPKTDPKFQQAKHLFRQHRWVQTTGAMINVILVLWLMLLPYRDFVVRDAGGPRESLFYVITTIHAVVGFFAFVFGNFVVLRGNNLMMPALQFNNYKPYMRIAYLAYILTTLLGVWVYFYWFTVSTKPPTFG
jgi:hypothetical protein